MLDNVKYVCNNNIRTTKKERMKKWLIFGIIKKV